MRKGSLGDDNIKKERTLQENGNNSKNAEILTMKMK